MHHCRGFVSARAGGWGRTRPQSGPPAFGAGRAAAKRRRERRAELRRHPQGHAWLPLPAPSPAGLDENKHSTLGAAGNRGQPWCGWHVLKQKQPIFSFKNGRAAVGMASVERSTLFFQHPAVTTKPHSTIGKTLYTIMVTARGRCSFRGLFRQAPRAMGVALGRMDHTPSGCVQLCWPRQFR